MKIVFLLLLSAVCTAGMNLTNLTGTFRVEKYAGDGTDPWVEDAAAAPAFFINGLKGGFKAILDSPDLVLTVTPVKHVDLEVECNVTLIGITQFQSDALRLAAAMAIEVGLEKLNKAIDEDESVDKVIVGKMIGFKWEPKSGAVAGASVGGTLVLTSQEALALADVVKMKTYINHVVLALGQAFGLGDDVEKIKAVLRVNLKSLSTRRRLLATSVEAEFKLDGLTPAQGEALAAKASSPSFPATLETNLAASDLSVLETATVSKIEIAASGAVYRPIEYEASASVIAGHAAGGNSEFKPFLPEYYLGVLPTGGFMFFMMVVSVIVFPCCYLCCFKMCKCCKKKDGPPKLLDAALIFAALSMLFALIGLIVTMQGEASMDAAFGDFDEAMGTSKATIISFTDTLDLLSTNLKNLDTNLAPFSNCELTENIRASADMGPIDLPTGDIDTTIEGAQTSLAEYAGTLSSATKGVGAVMFLAILSYSVFVIQIKFGGAKMERCRSVALGVVAAIFMPIIILCWLLAGLFQVLSVVLADFCITDPILQIFSFLPATEVSAGEPDPLGMLEFFVTCDGNPPDMLMTIYDLSSSMSEVADNFAGMGTFITAAEGCATVNITVVDESLSAVSDSIATLVDLARCKTFNPIFQTVLHSGVCTEMQAGFGGLALGLVFLSLFLMVAMLTFNRENRTTYNATGNKVEPTTDEEKPITSA